MEFKIWEILWTGGLSHPSGVHQCKQAITRKITRKLSRTSKELWHNYTQAITVHKPSTVSSSWLCYKNASKDCWKNEKHNRFPEDISNPPCCDVTLFFRTCPKLEKLWTGHLPFVIVNAFWLSMKHAEVLKSFCVQFTHLSWNTYTISSHWNNAKLFKSTTRNENAKNRTEARQRRFRCSIQSERWSNF